MILLQISNTNIVKMIDPENPVGRKNSKAVAALMKGKDITSITQEPDEQMDDDTAGLVVVLMVDMAKRFIMDNGGFTGKVGEGVPISDSEEKKYIESSYNDVEKALTKIARNIKSKPMGIKRDITDTKGMVHEVNVIIQFIEPVN